MLQPTEHLGFVEESGDGVLVLRILSVQRLERNATVQWLLPRLVHRSHPAFPKETDDPIGTKTLTFGEFGRVVGTWLHVRLARLDCHLSRDFGQWGTGVIVPDCRCCDQDDEGASVGQVVKDRAACAYGPYVTSIRAPNVTELLCGAGGLRGPRGTVPFQDNTASTYGPNVIHVYSP